MSYHIIVKKNQLVTYKQLLTSKYLPEETHVAFSVNLELPVTGYSKFYLTDKSTRGVAVTVHDHDYVVEVNLGASKADYLLAANIAAALAECNNSLISPESDGNYSIDEFQVKYDENWADSIKSLGIDALKVMVQQYETVKLPCCVRPYYLGPYMLNRLSVNAHSEEAFATSFIENIRRLQFIENEIPNLEIPTLMEGDFPEGVKLLLVVLPEYKLLIQKCDYIILRDNEQILKIEFDQFIQFTSDMLERIDEEQYILNPISREDFITLMAQLSTSRKTNTASTSHKYDNKNSWWKFWK